MKLQLLALAFIGILFSCNEKKSDLTIHKNEMMENTSSIDFGKVDNKIDPICNMETEGHVNDTVHYNHKVYGFCSSYCKDEFKKEPKKYVNN